MAIQRYHFKLFADYYQFYLQDEPVRGCFGNSWTKAAVKRMLAITDGAIGVGTSRNMKVPVEIEIRDSAPKDSFDRWDKVNECSIEVKSGRIVVAGCTDYSPDAARIHVVPGMYRARIYYGKLDALNPNRLEGEDHYRIALWLGTQTQPKVLKQRRSRN